MKNTLNLNRLASASFIALGLMACSADTSRAPSIPVADSTMKSKSGSDWLLAPQKHNNSGIAMRYKLEGVLKAGQPATLWLEFSGANANDAQVNIVVPKALSMGMHEGLEKSDQGLRSVLKINEVMNRALTFTPSSDGEHFLSFQFTQNGQQSGAGVMLRVGEFTKSPLTTGERITTEQGEKLIVMPAKQIP
jgi:hypothetical protein